MQTVRIGRTDLTVGRLAYGCWRVARSGNEPSDFAITSLAVHTAFDAGYTLFDHADIYCDGRAEAAFGRVLRESPGMRDKIVIATKCGIRPASQQNVVYRYDSSAAHIIQSAEASLSRLGVEQIDLFQIHRPDWLMDPAEVAEAFSQLARAGKVRHFGVSNFRPSQVAMLQSACAQPLAVNQVEISLLQLGALEDGTIDQCMREQMTPLAWSPLGAGLLADGAAELLPAQQTYQPGRVVAALDKMALHRGSARTALALAWLLRHPAGIIPIIGSTDPARIRAAVLATEIAMSAGDWYELLHAARAEPLP
jgi:predicted oxidoreductase